MRERRECKMQNFISFLMMLIFFKNFETIVPGRLRSELCPWGVKNQAWYTHIEGFYNLASMISHSNIDDFLTFSYFWDSWNYFLLSSFYRIDQQRYLSMESFRNFDQEKGYFLRGLSHLLNLSWINNYHDVVMTSLSLENINGSEKICFHLLFF